MARNYKKITGKPLWDEGLMSLDVCADRLVGSPHETNAPYTPFRKHHISLPYRYTAAKCDASGPTHLTHPFHAAIHSSPASII